jgi:hypothetical protein
MEDDSDEEDGSEGEDSEMEDGGKKSKGKGKEKEKVVKPTPVLTKEVLKVWQKSILEVSFARSGRWTEQGRRSG